jgi:hypothetical protein
VPTSQYGPYGVATGPVNTGIHVNAGDAVRIVSRGEVDFGGAVFGIGAPKLNANGDDWSTPGNYPAPSLRKNSLICEIGSTFYQGGTDEMFTPSEAGNLTLHLNDNNPSDNSRGWQVTVFCTPVAA